MTNMMTQQNEAWHKPAYGNSEKQAPLGLIGCYLYAEEDIIVEYDVAADGVTLTVSAEYIHDAGVDNPVAMIRGGGTYYYHKDGLGSVTEITDSAGSVVNSYEYKTFGTISKVTGTLENPYTYTGREYDAETGLYYYRARKYNAMLGRFLQRDPIGIDGGLNMFIYVGNNPVNMVDPTGMSTVFISIERTTETANSTTGILIINSPVVFRGNTLELPWRENENDESRIPPGTYFAKVRRSPSRGEDVVELIDVPNRTRVQIHVGNIPRNTRGCILPGENRDVDVVNNSRAAFNAMMNIIRETQAIDRHLGESTQIIVGITDNF